MAYEKFTWNAVRISGSLSSLEISGIAPPAPAPPPPGNPPVQIHQTIHSTVYIMHTVCHCLHNIHIEHMQIAWNGHQAI